MRNVALIVVTGLLLLAVTCSCSPQVRYVPVEIVRTEYLEADTTAIYNRLRERMESERSRENTSDSLIDRWKETVVLKENGDTARHYNERIIYRSSRREKELERKVAQQDSIIKDLRTQLTSAKVDSVPVPYPVEKPLTRWEKVKMDFGGMALGALALLLGAAVVWIVRKFRK